MSPSNEQTRTKTPFEIFSGCPDSDHPIDLLVASRLPQMKLQEQIRDAVDEMRIALGERESLWRDVEEKLNERHATRNEAYFNLGYECGLAAGRSEAFRRLGDESGPDTRKFAERLRALLMENALPSRSIIAVLLETAWVFALDISASGPTDNET